MSDKSNNQGRAYEYICLITLYNEIIKVRPTRIDENSSYLAARRAWQIIDEGLKETLKQSANSIVYSIFDLEPLILEDDKDILTLSIQSDERGKEGDVRDILIARRGILWEIGLSVKHNHFAVKHSRLSPSIDFGEKWFSTRCSDNYWNDIRPIFDRLDSEKRRNKKWSEISNKEITVYKPLLKAFMDEINRSYVTNRDIPTKMVEYLLGKFDFYKVISLDLSRMTQIQSFNLRATLNKKGKELKPKRIIPIANLPTRIVNLDFKPLSNNTIELYLDNGWQFSFRIHNASTYIETSLKFDIQIIGMPTNIITINCHWL